MLNIKDYVMKLSNQLQHSNQSIKRMIEGEIDMQNKNIKRLQLVLTPRKFVAGILGDLSDVIFAKLTITDKIK